MMRVQGVLARDWNTQGRGRKARRVIGARWIPFWLLAGRRKTLRRQCYLCFGVWQASNSEQEIWTREEMLLNVALVFGMALAVGEADAAEDKEAAEDLGW